MASTETSQNNANRGFVVASMHVLNVPTKRVATRLASLPADRWEIASASGCLFGTVMGTSRIGTTRMSVDLRRWTLFCLWRDIDFYSAFAASSPMIKRWESVGKLQSALLKPLVARGTWNLLPTHLAATKEGDSNASVSSQIAVVTRNWVKLRYWLRAARATSQIDEQLQQQDGCNFALGMGQWPIGEQATFSIWDNAEAINNFAYKHGEHLKVMREGRRANWMSEEFFARFAVLQSDLQT